MQTRVLTAPCKTDTSGGLFWWVKKGSACGPNVGIWLANDAASFPTWRRENGKKPQTQVVQKYCLLRCHVVWNVTPYGFVRGYRCFGRTFCDVCELDLMVLHANSCNSLWCCRPTAVTAYGAACQQLWQLMVLQANSCDSLWCCMPTAVTAYGAACQQL